MQRKLRLKPALVERMQSLLEEEYPSYLKILEKPLQNSIRCNTIKISPEELKIRLEKKWKISQPWPNHPEVMIVETDLLPGELGRSLEHLLGYYYIQELASMLPAIAMEPKQNEEILDLCAAPGSKTTQIAALMKNTGTIIANEISLGRIKILASNLERCGVTNTIISRKDGIALCKRLKNKEFLFDRILVDAPCSGEGTLRSSAKTALMWNQKTIKSLSKLQKALVEAALEILKPNGILIYSTCTHAPEENEEVVDFVIKNFNVKIEKINLPIKCREGIQNWRDQNYSKETKCACRIYPQDSDTEGFFVARFRKLK